MLTMFQLSVEISVLAAALRILSDLQNGRAPRHQTLIWSEPTPSQGCTLTRHRTARMNGPNLDT